MAVVTGEAEYAAEIDREAVARARRSWPDLTKVRRVRIENERPHHLSDVRPFPHTGQDFETDPRGPATIAAALARQRMEEADDGN
ncbi:MAG: hypothetical protein ACYDHN_01680 [Solirubrobacteraceae bacterium]